jgi:hypothetical protein
MQDFSEFSEGPSPNPYAPSTYKASLAGGPPQSTPGRESLPTFCLVYFVIDLVFCCMRALLVLLGIVNLTAGMGVQDPMVKATLVYEVGAGLGMVLLGIPANLLMLFRQRAGVFLAIGKLLATFASFGVGIWQLSFIIANFPEGSPERIGAMVGAGMTMVLRLGLVAVYIGAIVTFWKWLGRRDSAGMR